MPRTVQIGDFTVQIDRVLGEGGFGKVYRCKDAMQQECAAKQVPISSSVRDSVMREVKFLEKIGTHASIIQLRGFHEITDHKEPAARNSFWIFMEMANGGELFDRLIDSGQLSEKATRPYMHGMAHGLQHCHQSGVIHRDIKLENVMLVAEDPYAVKIVDFGLAVYSDPASPSKFTDRVGSKSYRAPEILSGGGYLGAPVDVWALGIVVFSLVSGFFPLDEARNTDWRFTKLAQDQARGTGSCDSFYSMYKRQCPFSTELKDLLDHMLLIDPTKRITIGEVCESKWVKQMDAVLDADMFDENGEQVVYRSAGGMEIEEELPAFVPAEGMLGIGRQKARFASESLDGGIGA